MIKSEFPAPALSSLLLWCLRLTLLGLALLLPPWAAAAEPVTGSVEGRVFNASVGNYLRPRNTADLTAEYRLTRHFSVFVSGRNINEAVDDTLRYGPLTPPERSLNTRYDYRAYWNVGVKLTF